MLKIPTVAELAPVFSKGIRKTISIAEKNLPTIFAGCALGCLAGAVVTTATGMHKADKLILDEERRREETLPVYENKGLTLRDKAQLTWKSFIPAGLFTGAAAFFIIASERKGHAKYLALMSAYELSKQAMDERKEAESDVLPESNVKLVEERARQLRAENADASSPAIPHVTRDGDETLYIESYTRTPFYAKGNDVLHAFNHMNHVCNMYDTAKVSDILEDLGLRTSPASDGAGWNKYQNAIVEPSFRETFLDDDPSKPATLIEYSIEPEFNYGLDRVQY